MGSKLFWSSLFGIVIIILLAATLYVRSIAPQTNPQARPLTTSAPSPAASPSPTIQLAVTFPADESLSRASPTKVSGKSWRGATITIVGGKTDTVAETDNDGAFSTQVTLAEGVNTLMITAIDDQGNEASAKRTIVYEQEEKVATRSATPSADNFAKTVVVGTIAKVTGESATIKTKFGTKTLSLTDTTSIRKGTAQKQAADLAKDQSVAVVAKTVGASQTALTVHILPEKDVATKKTYAGTVTTIAAKTITMQTVKARQSISANTDTDTVITLKGGRNGKLTDVTLESKVVMVVTPASDEPNYATRIHILVRETNVPSPTPAKPESESSPSADTQTIIKSAQQKLAGFLNIPIAKLPLVSQEKKQWPDTGLGVNEPGKVFAQVITPGFRFVFELDSKRYEMHTDANGKSMVLVDPLKRF